MIYLIGWSRRNTELYARLAGLDRTPGRTTSHGAGILNPYEEQP